MVKEKSELEKVQDFANESNIDVSVKYMSGTKQIVISEVAGCPLGNMWPVLGDNAEDAKIALAQWHAKTKEPNPFNAGVFKQPIIEGEAI